MHPSFPALGAGRERKGRAGHRSPLGANGSRLCFSSLQLGSEPRELYTAMAVCSKEEEEVGESFPRLLAPLSDVALGSKFLFTCKTAQSAKTELERCCELSFRAAKEIWHEAALSLCWPLDREVIDPHPVQLSSTSRESLRVGVTAGLWACN